MSPARRRLITAMTIAMAGTPMLAMATGPLIEVWKGPGCDCCREWVKHLEANGFQVKTHDNGNGDARARLGMPIRYGACHTGEVGGYAIEGHVPAREIHRLLKDRPTAVGLAVPGMPRGSPGMDGPANHGQRDPHDVLLVQRDGSSRVYQSYR